MSAVAQRPLLHPHQSPKLPRQLQQSQPLLLPSSTTSIRPIHGSSSRSSRGGALLTRAQQQPQQQAGGDGSGSSNPPLAPAPPPQLAQHLLDSNSAWLAHFLDQPLQLPGVEDGAAAPTKVYLLGVCFWAPQQHQLVASALQRLQPDEVLIEQPPAPATSAGGLLLPCPAWVQTALEHEQQWQQSQEPQPQSQLDAFAAELAACAPTPSPKVGKDIVDPWETFGYYSGLDYVQRPASVAQALQLCRYLPGQEIVTAVQYALQQGARLRCIDAPVRLQESWVKGLVSSFTSQLSEAAVNSYQPVKDFAANQQAASSHLPAAAAQWDKALADAAAQLQRQAAASPQAAEQQALLLFKASKATAAALLPPDGKLQAEVLSRMQRLQPLKWRHQQLRLLHMAQQVKEAALLAAKQQGANASGSGSRPPTLLLVVGRQHCTALRAMWCDPASSLWSTHVQVPRTFAPSVVESLGGAAAAGGGPTEPS